MAADVPCRICGPRNFSTSDACARCLEVAAVLRAAGLGGHDLQVADVRRWDRPGGPIPVDELADLVRAMPPSETGLCPMCSVPIVGRGLISGGGAEGYWRTCGADPCVTKASAPTAAAPSPSR